MSGPLWFGAECLAAGSSVLNHESESDELRPLGECSFKHKEIFCSGQCFTIYLKVGTVGRAFVFQFWNAHFLHYCYEKYF